MKTNHTPGPWSRKRPIPEDPTVSRLVFAHDDLIASVHELEGAAHEAAANARLIAAAPDLFEALKALMSLDVKGHQLQDRLQFSDAGRALLAQCRAALALVEG